MTKCRIAHLACVAPPETGGIGAIAAAEVSSLSSRGCSATLIAPLGHVSSSNSIQRMPCVFRYGNASILRPRSLLRVLRAVDIVHLHYPWYGSMEMVCLWKRLGLIRHLVLTLHMDAQAEGVRGRFFDLYRALLQSWELASADALIASSRDYLEHSSFCRVAQRAIELPFGVDEDFFSPQSPTLAFDIPQDAFVVLFVGGMDAAHEFKGVEILLQALVRLPHDVWGLFVGEGERRQAYQALANHLGITQRVKFVGRVDHETLRAAYHRAHVLGVPSTSGAEAFSLTALEAQACGVPVIASALPGVRTVVADGMTGLLVPPKNPAAFADAVHRLMKGDARQKFGQAARRRVATDFTWKTHIDRLVRVYENVCASPS